MDYKLEVVVIPVSDVDKAKQFYSEKVGFNVDVDNTMGNDFRNVQLTPHGSACSVTIGTGLTHPELLGKHTRIEVRCAHMPDARALELLGMIHDQLDFQDIKMEVVVANVGAASAPR